MHHIIVIGNGIAGVTAARHIRKKSNFEITIISEETEHFFSRTALMYIYMGHMRYQDTKPYEDRFWKKNRINLLYDKVEDVDTDEHQLRLVKSGLLHYDSLIIACGSKPNFWNWPGQTLKGVQGLYSYPDLLKMVKSTGNTNHAVVVGGGLIGIEMCEMLLSRRISVSFLVREDRFWGNVLPRCDADFIEQHIRHHAVDLRLHTELERIIPNDNMEVQAVVTRQGEQIPCQFVGIATGVSPNVEFLKKSKIAIQRGVLVDEWLRTNIENVYAIGDCAERKYDIPHRKRIEQVWYTGRIMGETVANTLCGTATTYQPGVWFNSAKFFDIEYQTYGYVPSKMDGDKHHFFWKHPDCEKAAHFVWDKQTKQCLGVNVWGIRWRHEIFDRWLAEKKEIDYVMDRLPQARFDPEFFDNCEKKIAQIFAKQYYKV